MKTPETDNLARGNHVVPTEWAEQLERERDEARKLAEAFHQDQVSLLRERDEAREERDKLKQLLAADSENVDAYLGLCIERNEAMQKYDNLATEHMLAINKICNERDEAREMAQQLIHIASHCLGWHDNSNPETIADAINRWNATKK